jgi:hypothetical protein
MCQASQNILSYLSGALLNYRDEGVELSPKVLFCLNSGALFEYFPGTIKYSIGAVSTSPDSIKRILKDCAPLAAQNWNIFIERENGINLKYGVFSYSKLPTALPLEEAISLSPSSVCLLVKKTSQSTVEILGSKGNALSIMFSTMRENVATADPISPFSGDCCAGIDNEEFASEFRDYFYRLLGRMLARSHGTIIACSGEGLSEVEELSDGIPIDPKLDFFSIYSEFRRFSTVETILKLQSFEELLLGILQCDGVVVFDTKGAVVAYRVFYKPRTTSGEQPQVGTVVGGARRRAFEGIKLLVGRSLSSALFRSQDGLTIYEGRNNV